MTLDDAESIVYEFRKLTLVESAEVVAKHQRRLERAPDSNFS